MAQKSYYFTHFFKKMKVERSINVTIDHENLQKLVNH